MRGQQATEKWVVGTIRKYQRSGITPRARDARSRSGGSPDTDEADVHSSVVAALVVDLEDPDGLRAAGGGEMRPPQA